MDLGQFFAAQGWFGPGPAQPKSFGPGPGPNPFLRDGFGPKWDQIGTNGNKIETTFDS